MGFSVPNFILPVRFWRATSPPPAAPAVVTVGNLAWGRRVTFSGSGPDLPVSSTVTPMLLLPAFTDVRGPEYVLPPLSSVLIDLFAGVAGTTLPPHVPDLGGPWVSTGGPIALSAAGCEQTDPSGTLSVVTFGSPSPVTAVVGDLTSNAVPVNSIGFVLRWVDAMNFVLVCLTEPAGDAFIYSASGGVYTSLATAPTGVAVGTSVTLTVLDDGVTVSAVIGAASISAVPPNAVTNVAGLYSDGLANSFQSVDFSVAIAGGPSPDIAEVPALSGRFYEVVAVDDIGKGFPNEHRFAALVQLPPWPHPIP